MRTISKTWIIALLGIPMIVLASCSKVAELASVDVTYKIPRTHFTYTPVTLKSGEQILYSDFVKINVDSLLNANGLSSGTVQDPICISFSITITAPPEATFGWLQSARAMVADNAAFSSAVEIGSVVNSGGTGKTVVLTVNNNVIPFGSTGFYIRIDGILTGPVPYAWVQMYFDSELRITLEPL